MMIDFKYHTVWHVLITDSQKRGHSLVKHTTQSQTHNTAPHLFSPITAYSVHVECHGSGVLTTYMIKPVCFWNVICLSFFFFFKKKKERKSNNIVMDKLIWLLLKKRILRKAVNLEIEEINQQRFPAYLSTYLST